MGIWKALGGGGGRIGRLVDGCGRWLEDRSAWTRLRLVRREMGVDRKRTPVLAPRRGGGVCTAGSGGLGRLAVHTEACRGLSEDSGIRDGVCAGIRVAGVP